MDKTNQYHLFFNFSDIFNFCYPGVNSASDTDTIIYAPRGPRFDLKAYLKRCLNRSERNASVAEKLHKNLHLYTTQF